MGGKKNFPPNKNKLSDRKGTWEVYFPNLIRAERKKYGTCNNESVSDEELRSVQSETLSLWIQYIHCERGASSECTAFQKGLATQSHFEKEQAKYFFRDSPNKKGEKSMAEITKWSASQVLPIIRHNMRHLEDGNNGGNDAIKPELTANNYSLVDRGKTCKDINQYRKSIEKECFKYKRKNLVHAV